MSENDNPTFFGFPVKKSNEPLIPGIDPSKPLFTVDPRGYTVKLAAPPEFYEVFGKYAPNVFSIVRNRHPSFSPASNIKVVTEGAWVEYTRDIGNGMEDVRVLFIPVMLPDETVIGAFCYSADHDELYLRGGAE